MLMCLNSFPSPLSLLCLRSDSGCSLSRTNLVSLYTSDMPGDKLQHLPPASWTPRWSWKVGVIFFFFFFGKNTDSPMDGVTHSEEPSMFAGCTAVHTSVPRAPQGHPTPESTTQGLSPSSLLPSRPSWCPRRACPQRRQYLHSVWA